MGAKNDSGIRKVRRGGRTVLVIDFRYTDSAGVRQRYRRDASVQARDAAHAEARRLMKQAAETGVVEAPRVAASLTYAAFVTGSFTELYEPRMRPGTVKRYRDLHRQRVLAAFGPLPMPAIDANTFRAFAAVCIKAGVQTRGPVNLVRTVLRAAVETGHLDRLPDVPKGLTKASKKLPDAPGWEEIQDMLEAPGWLGVAIALAALAGLRLSEMRALEVRDVDFEHHRLLVRRGLSDDVAVPTKTGEEAVIPMEASLEARLKAATKDKLPLARVVLTERGTTPRRQHVLTRFKAFLAEAGIREWSFHSLRHHFVSELLRRGVGAEAVRMLARHSKLEMTARYAHAVAGDLRAGIDKLGDR